MPASLGGLGRRTALFAVVGVVLAASVTLLSVPFYGMRVLGWTAVMVLIVRRRQRDRTEGHSVWTLLAIAGALQFSTMIPFAFGRGVTSTGTASLATLGSLLAAPFFIAAMLATKSATTGRTRWQTTTDTVVAGLAFAVLTWQIVTPQIAWSGQFMQDALPLAHTVVAAVMATCVVRQLSNSAVRSDLAAPVVWWLAAGGFLMAVAHVILAIGLMDLPMLPLQVIPAGLSAFCFAIAALLKTKPEDEGRRTLVARQRVAVLAPVLPLVFAAGGLMLGAATGHAQLSTTSLVLSLSLLVMLTFSTVLARIDALDVSRTLEDRVAERTLVLGTREKWFSALVQNSSDVISVVDLDGTIRYVTPSAVKVLGHDPALLLGTKLTGLMRPDDARALETALREAALGPFQSSSIEFPLWHREGGWCETETVITSLIDDPSIRGIVLNTRDISERRALEDELTRQAFSDSLTGLANRSLFRDSVEASLEGCSAGGVAVLFLDLNGFKAVNDSQGHAVGDQLLELVGQRLRNCVRPGDVVARLGGDEFAVLVTGEQAESGAVWVADRVRRTLANDFVLEGRGVTLGAAIGIALNDEGGETADQIMRNADLAMYRAKASQRTEFLRFESAMHDDLLARVRAEADLRKAIGQGDLVLHYQPLVCLNTGAISGVEALVRWLHPERGLIQPLEFIEMAEETGLVEDLGAWALDRACKDAATWQRFGTDGRPFKVAVNVSARQVSSSLPRQVRDVLALTGLPASALTLEMTESVLMDRPDESAAILSRAKSMGVKIAVDDFGTGYSSLSYLARFPVDVLKIDRSFVEHVLGESEQSELVRTIVHLGTALNLTTVAEGIETVEQRDVLRDMGCTLGQGFWFARPLPYDELTRFLEEQRITELVPTQR